MPTQPQDRSVTKSAIQYVESRWGIKCYGFATSGHIANSKHYRGLASDCMTEDAKIHQEIVAWAMTHPDIDNIISMRKIWSKDRGWRAYHGTSPHTNHVHIDFKGLTSPDLGTLPSATPPAAVASPTGALEPLGALSSSDLWSRVFQVIFGLALLVYGLIALAGKGVLSGLQS
jgi:hypothetical protein